MPTSPTDLPPPPSLSAPPDLERLKRDPVTILTPSLDRNWRTFDRLDVPPDTLKTSRDSLRRYAGQTTPISRARPPRFPRRIIRSPITGLPSYLRGELSTDPKAENEAEPHAQEWLDSTPDVPTALLGNRTWRQFFSRPPEILTVAAGQPTRLSALPRRFHVRYQQWYGDWPVLGGTLTVHMSQGNKRVSCTSSYVPVLHKEPLVKKIDEDQARLIAQKALCHYEEPKHPLRDAIAGLTGAILGLFGRIPDPPRLPTAWSPSIHPHAGQPCVVLPFAGDCHLAYEVYLKHPTRPETWSVFVDAKTGNVLGRPENMSYFVSYYESSQAVLTDTRTELVSAENKCVTYFADDVRILEPGGYRHADPAQATGGLDFEAVNVAVHASKMYDYLVECGAQSLKTGAKCLSLWVNELVTNFDSHSRQINFQHDDDKGVPWGGGDPDKKLRCHNPAYDPELIYHEVAHGLMWLFNPDPFQHWVEAAPFARSLIEGYATYFARSYGAQVAGEAGTESSRWAEAAYPQAEWCDRWAFARDKVKPGEDKLAHPNLYPQVEGLEIYDVGMIWARALWDLRMLLDPDKPELADARALDAFSHAHGWVTSFEAVAEGLMEAPEPSESSAEAPEPVIAWNDVLLPLLANRGIVAQQGIQALAAAGDAILVGADAGLRRSTDGGTTWGDMEECKPSPGGQKNFLSEVVALTARGDTWYAATEDGIFRRAQGDDYWKAVEGWTDRGRPLALACSEHPDRLYASTGQGIWAATAPDGDTPHWEQLSGLGGGLPLDLAMGATQPVLCIAGLNVLAQYRPPDSPGWAGCRLLQGVTTTRFRCVATSGEMAFFGTDNEGIREYKWDAGESRFVELPRSLAEELEGVVVLSLAVGSDEPLTLYAGTTGGVFRGVRESAGQAIGWTRLSSGLPADVAVTKVLWANSRLFAGTALHGLWQYDGTTWAWVQEMQSMAGHTISTIGQIPATSLDFTAAASAKCEVYLFPFQLTERQTIQVCAKPDTEVKLLSLGPRVARVAASTQSEPGFYAVVLRAADPLASDVTIKVSVKQPN